MEEKIRATGIFELGRGKMGNREYKTSGKTSTLTKFGKLDFLQDNS
jgi:hypothetical protein